MAYPSIGLCGSRVCLPSTRSHSRAVINSANAGGVASTITRPTT